MFVETAGSNTCLLHHIGNADAFQTEFAKPLGSNAHDPRVSLRLVTLRITHLLSPSLPSPHGSPQAEITARVLSYATSSGCKPPSLGVQENHGINNKHHRGRGQMK